MTEHQQDRQEMNNERTPEKKTQNKRTPSIHDSQFKPTIHSEGYKLFTLVQAGTKESSIMIYMCEIAICKYDFLGCQHKGGITQGYFCKAKAAL